MSRPLSRTTVNSRVKRNTTKIRNEERKPEWRTAQFDIKIVDDLSPALTGDSAFVFMIPFDLVGADLVRAEAYVTSAGGADTVVQVRNITNGDVDMLTDPVTIDSGDVNSYVSASPSVVDPATSVVSSGDLIAIDIDADGGGALGLGVVLDFS